MHCDTVQGPGGAAVAQGYDSSKLYESLTLRFQSGGSAHDYDTLPQLAKAPAAANTPPVRPPKPGAVQLSAAASSPAAGSDEVIVWDLLQQLKVIQRPPVTV